MHQVVVIIESVFFAPNRSCNETLYTFWNRCWLVDLTSHHDMYKIVLLGLGSRSDRSLLRWSHHYIRLGLQSKGVLRFRNIEPKHPPPATDLVANPNDDDESEMPPQPGIFALPYGTTHSQGGGLLIMWLLLRFNSSLPRASCLDPQFSEFFLLRDISLPYMQVYCYWAFGCGQFN